MNKIKNIAILGGAFNPITKGHIQICEAILNACKHIDKVYLMPCYNHMYGKQMATSEQRLEMCELASKNNSKIKVFDYEIKHKLSGKTFDVINKLIKDEKYKNYNLFSMIIGQDNANTFNKWYRYEELIKLIPFIIVPRKGIPVQVHNWYMEPPHIYLGSINSIMQVSSTRVRDKIRNKYRKETLKHFLDKKVINYIFENDLYI